MICSLDFFSYIYDLFSLYIFLSILCRRKRRFVRDRSIDRINFGQLLLKERILLRFSSDITMGRLYVITLEGNLYSCKYCKTHFALSDDIISKVSPFSSLNIYLYLYMFFFFPSGVLLLVSIIWLTIYQWMKCLKWLEHRQVE